MRRLTTILVFMILLNATIPLLGATGVFGALGVSPAVQTGGALEDTKTATSEIDPNAGTSDGGIPGSFVGAVVGLGVVVETILQGIFAAPTMFKSLGVPELIVDFVFAPLYLLSGLEMVRFISGRDFTT